MVILENLSKKYKGAERNAVDNVSLRIKKGEIFGLLGPNGAGKTTIFSMMSGIFPPNKGEIFVDGKSIYANFSHYKINTGIVPQDIALYPSLTGRENLSFFGRMYGLKGKNLSETIEKRVEEFGLKNHIDKKIKNYSGGLKRRINIIAGILHNPSLLLLDEPAVGIDAHSRAEIMQLLNEINKSGTTIIYTSHYLEEAEKFCSDIAVINNGNIITQGNPEFLIKKHNCCKLEEVFFKLTQNN